MAKYSDGFGKFVRLKLIGEVVQVVSSDSDEITINFKGKILPSNIMRFPALVSKKRQRQRNVFQGRVRVESTDIPLTLMQ